VHDTKSVVKAKVEGGRDKTPRLAMPDRCDEHASWAAKGEWTDRLMRLGVDGSRVGKLLRGNKEQPARDQRANDQQEKIR
jgi:hypothetical protein